MPLLFTSTSSIFTLHASLAMPDFLETRNRLNRPIPMVENLTGSRLIATMKVKINITFYLLGLQI